MRVTAEEHRRTGFGYRDRTLARAYIHVAAGAPYENSATIPINYRDNRINRQLPSAIGCLRENGFEVTSR